MARAKKDPTADARAGEKAERTPAIEMLPVSLLLAYPKNARVHSASQIEQIARSITEFGFTNPILVDAGATIIAGHGRVEAAKKLDIESVPCIRLAHLSKAQIRAYVIADNQLAINADWDEAILAEEIAALHAIDFDISLTGFDASDFNQPENKTREFQVEFQSKHCCPKCGFEFDEFVSKKP